ncbi:DUF1404 domain-containing protein [Acidianus sulfidivorans JP7]|uniref:DUF1404 domain-containing protein n=1 Tax=Acidianus sulfidivorans JP7 TaxID=619593 RepID=A0A2U9ILA0_9CREN|nr:DUF1404 domain-containing protein [Acidianus sulfidivorans]AWR96791.1 DUF1404 domain-containing protein [Acidianus sulfidivorans JP7]
MIRYNSSSLSWRNFVIPIALVVAFVNPYTEFLQFTNPIVYMLDHYALYAAGVLIGYKLFRGSIVEFILGLIPAVFWHIPYFFALGASFITFRALCEITLFGGGILAGAYIPKMSLNIKIASLASYMLADSILSIFFILSYPQYSNVDYSFLKWGPGALPPVGISMFVVMNLILIYAIVKIMRGINLF